MEQNSHENAIGIRETGSKMMYDHDGPNPIRNNQQSTVYD